MSPVCSPWPFVGRGDLVHETESNLRSGRSVILVGHPGVGKTSLANQALHRMQDTTISFPVRGTPALSEVPYGALGVLLSDLDPQDFAHPLFVLQGLTRLLVDRAGGRQIVLFVDNIQDLDDMSALVLGQLVSRGTIVVLCVCRTMGEATQEFSRLWRDGALARIDVGPMSLKESAQLFREQLRGPISGPAGRELWSMSGGNPLYLHVLIREQLANKNLVLSEHGWVLAARIGTRTRQVEDVLITWFDRLSAEQTLAVEVVSMAGSLPLDLLMKLSGQTDIDSLQEKGILEVDDGPEQLVAMTHPLVADVVKRNVPPGRGGELRERLVEVGSGQLYPPIGRFAFATWTLSCGAPLEPALAVAAARDANELQDPDSALKFLGALDAQQRARPEAASEQMKAMISLGNFAGALTVVNRLLADEAEPSLANWVDLTLACVSLSLHEPRAKAVAHHALKHLKSRLGELTGADSWTPHMARLLEKVELAEIELAVFEGHYSDILETLESAFRDHSYSATFRLSVGVWLSEAWAVTERQDDGAQLAESLVDSFDPEDTAAYVRESSEAALFRSLLLSGRWAKCGEVVGRWRLNPDNPTAAANEVFEGILHAHKGRADDALALLLPSIDQLRVRRQQELLALALAASAYSYCMKNAPEKVVPLLAEIGGLAGELSWAAARVVDYFATLASTGLIPPEEAAGRLLNNAEECRSHGATAYELFSLSAAVRLGRDEIAERLVTTSGKAQGLFAGICGMYGRGIASSDPRLLLEAARMARSIGNEQWCYEAATSVLALGRVSSERDYVPAARRLMNTCYRAASTVEMASGATALTPRERQVAFLAAQGTASKEIAQALNVSVRTIEGHLYQIYTKLRVSGRAELERVLD